MILAALISAAPVQTQAQTPAQQIEVDLELVLAVDVSGSMDMREHAAQRQGYVDAFRHRDVLNAIRDGLTGRIAVAYVEWAGFPYQDLVVPWMVIEDQASADRFASSLEAAPIREFSGTSISAGLAFAADQFEGNGIAGIRRVIDVSGDGPNNRGRPIGEVRAEVLERGITINGLPIVLGRAGGSLATELLTPYYADCVIGGPGAFLIAVDEIERLGEAIRRKLVLEIVSRPGGPGSAARGLSPAARGHSPAARGLDFAARELDFAARAGEGGRPVEKAQAIRAHRPIDCLIGEKLRRRWYEEP